MNVPELKSVWRKSGWWALNSNDPNNPFNIPWLDIERELDIGSPDPTEDPGQRLGWVLDAAAMRSRMTEDRVMQWAFANSEQLRFKDPWEIALAFIRDIEREVTQDDK